MIHIHAVIVYVHINTIKLISHYIYDLENYIYMNMHDKKDNTCTYTYKQVKCTCTYVHDYTGYWQLF